MIPESLLLFPQKPAASSKELCKKQWLRSPYF